MCILSFVINLCLFSISLLLPLCNLLDSMMKLVWKYCRICWKRLAFVDGFESLTPQLWDILFYFLLPKLSSSVDIINFDVCLLHRQWKLGYETRKKEVIVTCFDNQLIEELYLTEDLFFWDIFLVMDIYITSFIVVADFIS